MGKTKGHFSKKGTRETPWGEKVKNLSTTLSEDGYRLVKERAKEIGVSISEILERWGRGYAVDSEKTQKLPSELDTTRDWQPQSREILAKAGESLSEASMYLAKAEESFTQVSSELEDLRQVLAQDQQYAQFFVSFLQRLAAGSLQMEDLDELTALIEFDDSDLERLTAIVQLCNGGKKPNGV